MTTLAAVQARMHDALVRPDADPDAATLFAEGGRLGAAAGLAIYQRGYLARIAGCMREQFPALCHALGRDLFDDFVAAYVADHPPVRHTLHDLGRRFPDWMAANRPDADAPEPWVDFMIALARFEYAVFALFDAEGNEGRAFATLDTLDEMLRLQPAFTLGRYDWPVAHYYHAVCRGEDPPVPLAAAQAVAMVRVDYLVHTLPLAPLHHAFLAAMAEGAPVAAALDQAADAFAFDRAEVHRGWSAPGGSRQRWIAAGFFVAATQDGLPPRRRPGSSWKAGNEDAQRRS